MRHTLDYSNRLEPKPRPIMAMTMGMVIFVLGVVALIYTIRNVVVPPPPIINPLAKINQYFSQTQTIISNVQLTDIEKSQQLLQIISAARKSGLLPLKPNILPSDGETELGVLLSDSSVRSAIGADKADEFLYWLQASYPTLNLQAEIHFRKWMATTKAVGEG